MQLTLKPTDKIERVDGLTCRRWEGTSDQGVPVHAWIRMVQPQTHDATALEAFELALKEQKFERRLQSFDYRMI